VTSHADDKLATQLATSGSGRTGGNPNQCRFRPLGDVPLFEKILCINGLGDILAVESGYEEGCKRGAKQIKGLEKSNPFFFGSNVTQRVTFQNPTGKNAAHHRPATNRRGRTARPGHHGEGHPGNNRHRFREYLPEILLRAIPVNEEDEQYYPVNFITVSNGVWPWLG